MPFIDLPTFTLIHVVISVVGIVAGLLMVGGLISGKLLRGWTGMFLWTTLLTNVTGFMFPFTRLLPSHIVGALSLLIIPIAMAALYWRHLEGGWRRTFIVASVAALYFNTFVLMVQLFQKMPALVVVAPNQKGPAFVVTQLLILALFVWMGREAVKAVRHEA